MVEKNERVQELAELERVVTAFGADMVRWPANARPRLERLILESAAARAIVAEARALDRMLDAAPRVAVAAERALVDRIMAAATATATTPATVSAAESRPTARADVIPLPRRPAPAPSPSVSVMQRASWRAAMAMAASLVAGIYLGGNISVTPVLQDFADALGIAIDLDATSIAMMDDAGDEDTL